VGGIESVTLSDEEARRRGTQKTVLERRSPPTFDVLIEIQTRDRLAVHQDVAEAVDALLRGRPLTPELRYRDEHDEIQIEKAPAAARMPAAQQGLRRQSGEGNGERPRSQYQRTPPPAQAQGPAQPVVGSFLAEERNGPSAAPGAGTQKTTRIYAYGVARNRLQQASRRLGVPVQVVDDLGEAEILVTLRSYYRKHQRPIVDAEQRGMPIYVLRANTINQMQQFLGDLFNLDTETPSDQRVDPVLQETQTAIDAVLNGERWIELPPATAYVRRLQHQMARQANLTSHSYGKEPYRRVRIFRD
jgi:hypothetical protein